MAIPVTLPQMGESVVEGTVERWLVREGERVEKDQIVCEVTTDKVDAEIPAPEAGVITKILVAEGTTVDVGVELALIDPAATATVQPSATPVLSAQPAAGAPSAPAAADEGTGRVSPLARRIGEDQGVPVDSMPGSGASGRVVKADVVSYMERGAAPPTAASTATGRSARATLLDKLAGYRVPQYRRPKKTRSSRSAPSASASLSTWWCPRSSRRTWERWPRSICSGCISCASARRPS